MSAEPAASPGACPARCMYAGLFGELELYPAAQREASQDASSLFYGRSSAMGWLTPAAEGASERGCGG